MSNGAFNPRVNGAFTLRGVPSPSRSRSLAVVERLMKAHDLSRSGLARRLDVTPGAVTNWFRRGEVPVESHRKIIDAFGVSADDLIDRPGAPSPMATPLLPLRSAEAAQFAAEWDKIRDPTIRAQIRAMVEAVVKAQIDADRKEKPKKDGDKERARVT